jgi:hypothetical protein
MKSHAPTIVAVALLVSVGAVNAQTPEPAPAAAQATPPSEAWTFNVGVNGSYEGNALFVGPGGEREFANYLTAGLTRAFTHRRGTTAVFGSASQHFYGQSTSLNDFRYDAGGRATHEVTRRLSWNGSASVSSGLARDAAVLTDVGLVLPSVTARTSSSSTALTYALSRKSSLRWVASHSAVDFASSTFSGGWSVGSGLSWTRQVTDSQSVGVTQDYRRTYTNGVGGTIHGILGTWQGTTPGGWTAYTSAGVRPYTVTGESGYRFAPALTASVTKPLPQGQAFGVVYERRIEETYGVDTTNYVVQSVAANYGASIVQNLFASVTGTYSRGTHPLQSDLQLSGRTAAAALTYRVRPRLSMSLGSSIYSHQLGLQEDVTSYRIYTMLAYEVGWR